MEKQAAAIETLLPAVIVFGHIVANDIRDVIENLHGACPYVVTNPRTVLMQLRPACRRKNKNFNISYVEFTITKSHAENHS